MNEQRPREYAAEILRLDTPKERRAALEQVPSHLRDWVEFYVRDAFVRRRVKAGRGSAGKGAAGRGKAKHGEGFNLGARNERCEDQ